MKYIKTVILENFQSHKYTVLDFNEGLNVIVGPSDTGKSAVIRAIKWALYNEPSGDYFIRQGENDVSVIIIFNDNTKIKRYRSKSKNQYILYNNVGDEIKYEGFGLGVPNEILERIGIEKINLDSEESNSINLGEQLEGPFLLSEKTSTRASAIGRLIGVNIIDDALKETLKDLRNSSLQKKNKDLNSVSIKEELKTFEYLMDLEEKLGILEITKENIIKKQNKTEILNKLNYKYIAYKKEIETMNLYLIKLKKVEEAERLIKDIENANRNYKYLNNKNKTYKDCKSQMVKDTALLNNLNGVDRLMEIENYLSEIVSLTSKLSKINSSFSYIKLNSKDIKGVLAKLKEMENVQIKIDDLNIKIYSLNKLIVLKEKYETNFKSINIGEIYVNKFNNMDKVGNNYKMLEKNIDNLAILYEKSKIIDKLKTEISHESLKSKEIQSQMKISLNRYKSLLVKQEVCPLCLSNIDDDKLEHIMEHYK